jgi:hypothetical protein
MEKIIVISEHFNNIYVWSYAVVICHPEWILLKVGVKQIGY